MLTKWLRMPNFMASADVILLVTAFPYILSPGCLEIGIYLPV